MSRRVGSLFRRSGYRPGQEGVLWVGCRAEQGDMAGGSAMSKLPGGHLFLLHGACSPLE